MYNSFNYHTTVNPINQVFPLRQVPLSFRHNNDHSEHHLVFSVGKKRERPSNIPNEQLITDYAKHMASV